MTLGGKLGEYQPVNPNDHVNMAQSTNDVSRPRSASPRCCLLRELFPALDALAHALDAKGDEFADVIKSGRTHLQDAVPVTLGQEFNAYAAAVRRATRLLATLPRELRELGIGGTATGTGINTPLGYRYAVVRHLTRLTGSRARRRRRPARGDAVAASGRPRSPRALRNLALELTRITNDLRLLASGPHTGLAEIILPSVQPGSSIMPGKVNPSMLECMNQVCFHVIGLDTTIAFAAQAGQLELNVMMPLMAFEILFSIEILKNFLPVFVEKCIRGIEADRDAMRGLLRQLAVAGHRAQSDHRLREGRGDREGVGEERTAIPDLLRRRRCFRTKRSPRSSPLSFWPVRRIANSSANEKTEFHRNLQCGYSSPVGFPHLPNRPLRECRIALRHSLPAASWVRDGSLHLTFAFLGEQNSEAVPPLASALATRLNGTPAVSANLGGIGFFPLIRQTTGGMAGRGAGAAASRDRGDCAGRCPGLRVVD